MHKYHILKNSADFNNDDLTAVTTTNTLSALNDGNNFEIFNHPIDRHDAIKQLSYFNDHNNYGGKVYHINNNGELIFSDNDVEVLSQCNNENNTNNKIVINKQSIYNNNTTSTIGKDIKQVDSSCKNVNYSIKPFDSDSTSAVAEDAIMEIPLLQTNYNNDNNVDGRNNCNNKHQRKQHQYDFKYVCQCQQKGFASNLNSNSTQTAKSKILWAIALCCIFMIVEFLGGYIAGSLAIMTDAAHLASDCISFIIGLVAIWLGSRPPDAKMSFGYKRFEVMGAIVSILGIWILTATLVLVAIQRIYSNDYDLDANTMMTISGIGFLINIIMIFILHTSLLDLPTSDIVVSHGHSHSHSYKHRSHHDHSYSHSNSTTLIHRHSNDSGPMHTEFSTSLLLPADCDADTDVAADTSTADMDTDEAISIELSSAPMVFNGNLSKHQQDGNEKNLNLRAAMIHVIGDLVQSVGVFIASVLIKIFPKAVFLDPLCTLLFSVIVIMTTINLFKESMHIIMDAVPQAISLDDLEMDLLNIEGVKSLHHINVWNHTSNHSILMVHLVIDILSDNNAVLMKATQLAGSTKYNIKHSTIQIERFVP